MIRFFLTLALATLVALPVGAQDRRPNPKPKPSHCIAIAHAAPHMEYIQLAGFRDPVAENSLRIRYLAHAAFLLQTAGGLSAVTDFTGFIGNVDVIPDIVTMNHAHGTHWTPNPDPAIKHVLPGWGEYGHGIEHHLDLGEMLIRNVPTDIRSMGGVEARGNSIFIFEVAGLCVGHLGHLHHEPSDEQYAALGRLDVVMAAVDGGMTLDLPTMIRVLNRLKSSVVIPMHWFEDWTLNRFVDGMRESFDVVDEGASELTVSLRSLPRRPTVVVLRPSYLREGE